MDPAPHPELLVRLSLVEGFTARHLRLLREAPPRASPDGLPNGPHGSLLRRGIRALASPASRRRAEEVLAECAAKGIETVPIGSPGYPAALAAVPDAPVLLYRKGRADPGEDRVAVVGSRYPTAPGREFARVLAGGLAARGIVVASGMARGIDASAHEGAIAAGGLTVAVLGCGIDVLYPPEAGALRDRIVERGCLLSEYPPGTPPAPHRFPARNRILSGLCLAVVVAEAAGRSGALITARAALDQGREVLAVPGNPWFPHTEGSNRLLRDGAAPATSARDVLEAIGRGGPEPAGAGEEALLAFLARPRHLDEIAACLRIPVDRLLPRLLELEMANLVARREGGYYKRVSNPR